MAPKKKFILAIDSSTSNLRVGLSNTSGQIFAAENSDKYRHAEFIFRLITDVIGKAEIKKTDIDAIVISTGPGSFTGLRVGMATAKALAVSLQIPIAGVSLFAAIAERLYGELGKAAVLVPSRRNEYYLGIIDSPRFDDDSISVIKADKLRSISDLPPLVGIECDLSGLMIPNARVITERDFRVSISDFIASGAVRLDSVGGDDISRLEPLYVQEFKAGKSK